MIFSDDQQRALDGQGGKRNLLLGMRVFKDALEAMLKDYISPPSDTRFEITVCDIDTEAHRLVVEWTYVPKTPEPDVEGYDPTPLDQLEDLGGYIGEEIDDRDYHHFMPDE